MTFRPFRQNPLGRAETNGVLLARLNEANRLLAEGRAAQAAPLFGQLAQAMEAGGHPRRAANLHARAAHAFADAAAADAAAGDAAAGHAGLEGVALEHARLALRLFNQYAMVQRVRQFSGNIIRKFQARGMALAAETLRREFGLPVEPLPVVAAPAEAAAHLPEACLKCGAPVRSDEVDWIDPHSAECSYCGTVIRVD